MVYDVQFPQEVVQNQRKMALRMALFGSLPLTVGQKLRSWSYRPLLGQMANDVKIGIGVELAGAQGIFLEEKVAVDNYVHLNCWNDAASRIMLRSRSRLDRGVHLQALGGAIDIGEQTYIGPYVCMAGPGNITIGRNCLISSHCGLYANNHIFADATIPIIYQGATYEGITIGEDCWLGTGVRVMDGVTIGRGCVIGAGAVVTKDIPPFSVAVGVPARVISQRAAHQSHDAALMGITN